MGEAISRWFDPFKADVVIATLPFISSGLWGSTINNLMTHCFWECDRWPPPPPHPTHTLTLTLMMWNHFWHPSFFSFSHYRFCGEPIKTVNIAPKAPSTQTHTLLCLLASLQPLVLVCENRCTFSMKFWSWLSADTRSVSMETGNWPCPLRFIIRTLTKKNVKNLHKLDIFIRAVHT